MQRHARLVGVTCQGVESILTPPSPPPQRWSNGAPKSKRQKGSHCCNRDACTHGFTPLTYSFRGAPAGSCGSRSGLWG